MVSHIRFENCFVSTPNGSYILANANGSFHSGKLHAIMGPSGAGKTTLLNALALRETGTTMTGKIFWNEKEIDHTKYRTRALLGRNLGYVMQKTVLLSTATVKETLLTAAQLRCPMSVSYEDKLISIEKVIKELGLSHRADALANPDMLSGGEMLRVSIGQELVTNPKLLFLDEPTSGLDSTTAFNVMETLTKLAHEDRLVVCTIHQPNSQITKFFDDVLLIAHGKISYAGSWEKSMEFFEAAGYPCPRYMNPSDHYLDVLSIKETADIISQYFSENQKLYAFEDMQKSGKNLVREGSFLNVTDIESSKNNDDESSTLYVTPTWFQFKVLATRSLLQWKRSPFMFSAEITQYLLIALFVGGMYCTVDNSATDGSFERLASLFFLLACICFTPPFTVVTVFEEERNILQRELQSHYYNLTSYFWAKTLTSWPIEILQSFLFSIISYFMVGYQTDGEKFLLYFVVFTIFLLASESIGLICAVATPNSTYAILYLTLVMLIFLSLGGFLTSSVPIYYSWITDINYFHYALVAVTKSEMNGLTLKLDSGISVDGSTLISGSLDNKFSAWGNTGILFVLFVIFRILAWFFLVGTYQGYGHFLRMIHFRK